MNVPERFALALNHLGARVLYCENPVSFFHRLPSRVREVQKGIFVLCPSFFGHRVNLSPFLSRVQGKVLASQITRAATSLQLSSPLFVYPHGLYCLTIAKEFRNRKFSMVHVCMDYPLEDQIEHVRLADLTLAIPDAAFDELQNDFGDKTQRLPQLGGALNPLPELAEKHREPADLSTIPHPRLLYAGDIRGRIDLDLLQKLLANHPEWHFISFGKEGSVDLPNAHLLPWRTAEDLEAVLDYVDVGLLPYDCGDAKNLHCVPLKLFDYFSKGMPVVSTPILYVRKHQGLVYVGSTPEELASAVVRALEEPQGSTVKQMRRKVAAEHAIPKVSALLAPLLRDKCSGILELGETS